MSEDGSRISVKVPTKDWSFRKYIQAIAERIFNARTPQEARVLLDEYLEEKEKQRTDGNTTAD